MNIYNIKDGTIVICDLAFNSYENDNHFLRVIHIPSSVSIIGINPFAGCIGLTIYCDSKWFKLENSILYSNDYSRLISSTNSKSEALKLNPNTKVIGAYALSYCRAKSIELPSNLQIIEDYAFSSSDIELLVLPNVERIGKGAFSYCKSLANVILKGETTIDSSIFDECPNLKHIFVTASKIEYYKKMLSKVADLIYEVGTWEDCLFGEINFAKEIFELGQKYWEGKDVTKDLNEAIKLFEIASELGSSDANKKLKEWGDYWFDGNKAIYSKNKLTIMGLWSLYTSEYEILEGTETVSDNAFCDLGGEIDYSYLDKIVIPSSVKTIGHSPFNKHLSEIICYSPYFEVDHNTLYSKDKERLIQCFAKTDEFVVPDEVIFIDDHAFYGCKSKKIFIPESVKKMGINPFIEMNTDGDALEIISYSPRFVIDNDALYEDNTKLISYWGKDDSFTVPNGIKVIGEYAFFASNLKTINMPDTINSIGDCAFGWCFSLEHVLAPSSSAEKFKRIMDGYQDMIRIEGE